MSQKYTLKKVTVDRVSIDENIWHYVLQFLEQLPLFYKLFPFYGKN